MQIALSIGVTSDCLTDDPGDLTAQLVTPPAVSGEAVEGGALTVSDTGVWAFGGAPATVTQSAYDLLIAGAVQAGPQPGTTLVIPAGTGGAAYVLRIRVQVAEDPGQWSVWRTVQSGTLENIPLLSAPAAQNPGTGSYTAQVVSDDGSGLLYWALAETTAVPVASALRSTGLSQPILGPGLQSVTGPAPAQGTTGYVHFLQENADGRLSAIATSPALSTTATPPAAFAASGWRVEDAGTGGDAIVTLTDLPADGGAPLSGIEYRIGTGVWVMLGDAIARPYEISNAFTDGVSAQVRIRALNTIGPGPQSSPKSVTTRAPATAPARMDASVLSAGQTTLSVTLSGDPFDGGAPITRHDLRHSSDGATWALHEGIVSPQTLTGLLGNTLYRVQTRAVNAVGAGAWSVSAQVTTDAVLTPPGAFGPGDWSLTDTGTGSDATLTVNTLPEDGGSSLTGLFVSISGGAAIPVGAATAGLHPLDDLFTDGVATPVILWAANALGQGPESTAKTVTTTAPGEWAIGDDGSGSFTITATPGARPAPTLTDDGAGAFAIVT